jgi:hypothetical protein
VTSLAKYCKTTKNSQVYVFVVVFKPSIYRFVARVGNKNESRESLDEFSMVHMTSRRGQGSMSRIKDGFYITYIVLYWFL